MNYQWTTDKINRRQHWLHIDPGSVLRVPIRVAGLVYEVRPNAFSVYGEDFEKNAYARKFLGVMPTIDEAKDLLLTITASQNI